MRRVGVTLTIAEKVQLPLYNGHVKKHDKVVCLLVHRKVCEHLKFKKKRYTIFGKRNL